MMRYSNKEVKVNWGQLTWFLCLLPQLIWNFRKKISILIKLGRS